MNPYARNVRYGTGTRRFDDDLIGRIEGLEIFS